MKDSRTTLTFSTTSSWTVQWITDETPAQHAASNAAVHGGRNLSKSTLTRS